MRRIVECKSGKIALGGVLAACSLTIMMLSCSLPAFRTGFIALSGLFPMIGVLIAGRTVGYLCWITSGILGMFLLPDKGNALLYLAFLGLYPVIKGQIESIRILVLEWIIKLLCFNLVFSVFWIFFQELFLTEGLILLKQYFVVVVLAGNIVFVCYDFLLSHVVALLCRRLH